MIDLTRRTTLAAAMALPLAAVTRVHAQAAGTLDIGVVSDPVTLDPAFSASFFETQVLYNLFETLLVAKPDGTVIPGLATMEMPDPLTYVLTLREGLTFHDGTPLDAAAVKANIDRMMDPATGSIRKPEFGPLTGVTVADARRVTLTLSQPYAPLPLVLTNRAGMMVSPTAVQKLGADFATHAVGAGPWKYASWTKNSQLVLEAFPGYWQGAKQPFQRLVYHSLPDETARLANLRSGTLQLIDSVPPQAIAALEKEGAVRVSQIPSLGFNAFALNCTRAPFADKRVRQAFLAAVDPTVMQKIVFFDTGRVSHGPLSPAVAWAFDPAATGIPHDPARSKALLQQAGVASPLPVSITVTNSPQLVRIAQIMQAQAGQAGFRVEVKQIDPTSLITVLRQRDFDLCMAPWSGRYDPDGNMFNYFTKDGANNFAGYDGGAINQTLIKARSVSDQAQRAMLYREAQTTVMDDAPMLFLHFDAILQASTAKLRWTQYPDAVFRLFDATMG